MNQILDYGEDEQNTSVSKESVNVQPKSMDDYYQKPDIGYQPQMNFNPENNSKKNIKIACSDTTKEINNKAGESFDKECLNNMRDIYIKAKYTESKCTAEDYNSFHKNYKEK